MVCLKANTGKDKKITIFFLQLWFLSSWWLCLTPALFFSWCLLWEWCHWEQRHKLGLKHSLPSLCLSVNSCWYLPTTSFTSPLLIYFILITSTYCLRFAYPPPLVPAILLSLQPSINPPSLTPLTFPECNETQVLIAIHQTTKRCHEGWIGS